jgi:hypothetical protein
VCRALLIRQCKRAKIQPSTSTASRRATTPNCPNLTFLIRTRAQRTTHVTSVQGSILTSPPHLVPHPLPHTRARLTQARQEPICQLASTPNLCLQAHPTRRRHRGHMSTAQNAPFLLTLGTALNQELTSLDPLLFLNSSLLSKTTLAHGNNATTSGLPRTTRLKICRPPRSPAMNLPHHPLHRQLSPSQSSHEVLRTLFPLQKSHRRQHPMEAVA